MRLLDQTKDLMSQAVAGSVSFMCALGFPPAPQQKKKKKKEKKRKKIPWGNEEWLKWILLHSGFMSQLRNPGLKKYLVL